MCARSWTLIERSGPNVGSKRGTVTVRFQFVSASGADAEPHD
jgi:hypothetical protein